MKSRMGMMTLAGAFAAGMLAVSGCGPTVTTTEVKTSRQESPPEMTSQGEMQSPGEMESQGEMVSPGKMIVD
ncbi:MAG: hypothetical protein IT449_04100 [Phycisphaerales bacterium]|nr:hypothetical protein [Phycisphaerales bacterium]